jgi:RNA-directed DNA polymerase
MKRHGDLFDKIVDPANIYEAYLTARKGKTWQDTVKYFESDLDRNLDQIRAALIDGSFQTSEYTRMMIYEPKEREIFRLPFNPDRIVQHAIMNVVAPIWDRMFIYDSYSCRTGKGIHAGSRRTMEFIRSSGPGSYCLQMDVSKFYPTIDQDILIDIIHDKIKCRRTLDLLEEIICSFPGGKNVPIGNYTSQWFGNLYLNEVDQRVKHLHREKYYIRYCDDSIIISQDKNGLHALASDLESYLAEHLNQSLSRCTIYPVSQGIDFLGYRHFPWGVLIRKSTVKRMRKRLKRRREEVQSGAISQDQYRSSIASVRGWLRWANSYNLVASLESDGLLGGEAVA